MAARYTVGSTLLQYFCLLHANIRLVDVYPYLRNQMRSDDVVSRGTALAADRYYDSCRSYSSDVITSMGVDSQSTKTV